MKVLKFGGTSVGSAQRIKNVASIVCDQEQKIVVLSAMAGTTNSLVEISECYHEKRSGKKPMRSFLPWSRLMSII